VIEKSYRTGFQRLVGTSSTSYTSPLASADGNSLAPFASPHT